MNFGGFQIYDAGSQNPVRDCISVENWITLNNIGSKNPVRDGISVEKFDVTQN